ncbi:MAG: SRPBCC domain-containing protein [Planctomycetota bacterium]|nr:SRPBCC domain-containing protein [Planctomycetota bacterium]
MADTPNTRSIDTSIDIAAPPESVWSALTTAEGLTNWFPLEARVTPGVGGKIWSSWGEHMQGECRIDVWEPNQRLKVMYPQMNPSADRPGEDADPWAGDLAATDYIISAGEHGTTLRLVHSGFSTDAVWDDLYDATTRGWSFELRGLRHYLERHPKGTRTVSNAMTVFDFPLDEAWRRLMGPDGLNAGDALEGAKEGDRRTITPAGGEELKVRVQVHTPGRAAALVVENWNEALLRFHFDEWRHPEPRRNAYLWISTYDLPEKRLEPIRRDWMERFNRLFTGG